MKSEFIFSPPFPAPNSENCNELIKLLYLLRALKGIRKNGCARDVFFCYNSRDLPVQFLFFDFSPLSLNLPSLPQLSLSLFPVSLSLILPLSLPILRIFTSQERTSRGRSG